MTGSVEDRKAALKEEFEFFTDPQERFEYIISKTKNLEPLPKELKIDEFFVKGCVSGLWVIPSFQDGKCYFKSDADSVITKGIAHLVCDMYSGLSPTEILGFDTEFLDAIGVLEQLSANRRNGLSQLIKRIRTYAEICV